MLWLLLAALTAASVAAILVPLLRTREAGPERAAFDRAVYRDQLAEIQRDVARGGLTETEAEAARLEVERRLLATTDAGATEPVSGARVDPVTSVLLGAFVAAASVALYLALGSPKIADQPLASRGGERDVAQAEGPPNGLAESAEKLAKKLKDNPNDGDGWLLLAKTQAVLARWSDAADSYKRALALTDNRPDIAAAYGEMLVLSSDGIVGPAAKEAFTTALAKDPEEVAARYYLALADAQAGKPLEAVEAWRKIEAESSDDAPWLPALRTRIAEAAKTAGIEPPPPLPKQQSAAAPPPSPRPGAPRGPSATDMEAAAQMAPEDRQAMIRGMVENLAQRLEANPDDAAGWERLANAYRVLGETEKAAQAQARAAAGGKAAAAAPPRGPSSSDMDAAARLSDEQRRNMVRGMVASLAQRLDQDPDDAAGWARLGRSYRILGEAQKAEEALAKAAALRPNDPDILLDQGQAMLDAEGAGRDPRKKLPPRFVAVMKRVEAIEPRQPEALWYLGLDAVQQQHPEAALDYWRRLVAMLPPGSEDRSNVQQAIDALQGAKP
jgi:cytochrome c-type biogenesis protein CcmH